MLLKYKIIVMYELPQKYVHKEHIAGLYNFVFERAREGYQCIFSLSPLVLIIVKLFVHFWQAFVFVTCLSYVHYGFSIGKLFNNYCNIFHDYELCRNSAVCCDF